MKPIKVKIQKKYWSEFSINITTFDYCVLEKNKIHIRNMSKLKYIISFDIESTYNIQWIYETLNIFSAYLRLLETEFWIIMIKSIHFSSEWIIKSICDTRIKEINI